MQIPQRVPHEWIRPYTRLNRFIWQHMFNVMGIRPKTEVTRIFEIANLVELTKGFIPIPEPDSIGRRHARRSGKDQLAPANWRNTGGTRRSVQLLQHRHAVLDVDEDRLQPFFRPTNPFDQKSLFEFSLFLELPHEQGCLPIEFQHWCHRIPLFMFISRSLRRAWKSTRGQQDGCLLTTRKLALDKDKPKAMADYKDRFEHGLRAGCARSISRGI